MGLHAGAGRVHPGECLSVGLGGCGWLQRGTAQQWRSLTPPLLPTNQPHQAGLQKMVEAKEDVNKMKAELAIKNQGLAAASKEAEALLKSISESTAVAEKGERAGVR